MATHEIDRAEWASYLDKFSQARQGVLVTVETVDPQTDPRIEAKSLPLVGLSFESKGGEAGAIQLLLGTEPDDRMTHTITRPKHVYHKTGAGLISDEINADEIIEITAESQPAITYLQFHPAPPK